MRLKFADLFAGIGGFHLALARAGFECAFVSEIDENARQTYAANFPSSVEKLSRKSHFAGDITLVDKTSVPKVDLVTAGFPCQPFSQAGRKLGFEDTRGTLFFEIAELIKTVQPKAYFLENVRNLDSHDGGRTIGVIQSVLGGDLGYSFQKFIVNAADYGVPQNRKRMFIIGFQNPNLFIDRPDPVPLKFDMTDILGGSVAKKIGHTLRVGGRRSGVGDRRNWDSYIVDGREKTLTPFQAKLMQGFPPDFSFPVSETEAMKQLGNSVAIPAVEAFATQIRKTLQGR